jgi:hypothetical protein
MVRTAGLALASSWLPPRGTRPRAADREEDRRLGQRLALTAVRCPASIAVEVGATFTCTGATASGEQFTIAGRITSKAGANFEYALAVVEPTYVAETAAAMLTTALGQGPAGAPAAVTCGAPGRHRLPADHKLTCTVVAPDGAATTITLTFKDDGT